MHACNINDFIDADYNIRFESAYKQLEEADYSDIVAAGTLSKLTNLTNLSLDINESFNDLIPLSGLSELTQLVLIQSRLSDISPLSGLSKLEDLWLVRTAVKDFSPVSHVKNLHVIDKKNF